MKLLTVKVTFLEESLGLSPASKDIYRKFIASKAEDAESVEEEVSRIGVDGVMESTMTIFPKDENNHPFIWDYQIRGFFKDSCSLLARVSADKDEKGKKIAKNESSKLTAFKKVVDGNIFVFPRQIPIKLSGPMDRCERSLRANTPQGERNSLACSETVPAGSTFEFTVLIMNPNLQPAVEEWLDYGFLHGFSQWRNSGKGSFTYEIISESNIGSLKEVQQMFKKRPNTETA